MSQGNAVCPNCRQFLPTSGMSSPMLRCPACGVQLRIAASGDAVFPQTTTPPPARQIEPAAPASISEGQLVQSAQRGQVGSGQRRRGPGFGLLEIAKVVAGGAVGLGLGYLVILAIQSGHNRETSQPAVEAPSARTGARREPKIEFPQFADARSAKVPDVIPSSPATFTAPSVAPIGSTPTPPFPSTPMATRGPKNPVKQQTVQPPPATPDQPLAGLTQVIKLPSLVDTAPVVLCPLHVPVGIPLGIAFNAVAANVPAEAAFLAEIKSESPRTWLVCYFPDTSGSPQDKRVLGEIRHADGELSFVWRTPIEDTDARRELSNCLLKLSCRDVAKTAVLREPEQTPRLKLDLRREVQTHTWPAADLPNEETLRLEIAEMPGFPTGAKLKDERRVLRLKERATIQFEQVSGAEINVEFRRVAENLQIVIRPEFRENAADSFPMTLPRLAEFKASLQKAVPEAEARIVALGKELKSLDRQLKDLGGRPASGPAFVAWQGRLRNLQSAASSARTQISRLQRRLPEMKARLANAPHLEQFLGDLQSRGTLRVQLYAECGDARLVVRDMVLDPAME